MFWFVTLALWFVPAQVANAVLAVLRNLWLLVELRVHRQWFAYSDNIVTL